ncbi:DUF6603 domain-containing protein [Hyalangium versicolor]|uniref:DUF6603 domain-containing protein n=1 Tax=Hyalangium versicolor TaxID=2861190 RepID=UPI001CCC4CAC|nr:DUF6603 domain-containing protein [Hyalangium versicolor]
MAETRAGIEIDPNTLTSIRALIAALEQQLEVDFVPGFLRTLDETLPLTSATFKFDSSKQRYELGIGFGVKIGEDSDGEAKHLEISINIAVKPDKVTGNKRPAEYGGSLKIPIAESGLTHLQFDGQFTSKAGDMWVLQCSFIEEQSLPLGALFGATAPALAALIPQELTIPLQQSLTLVVAGRVGASGGRVRLILGLGFHTNVDLGQFPLVGVQFSSEQTRAFVTLELLVATHAFTHKELKALNGVLMELGSPLRIQPPSSTQQELTYGVYAGLTAVFGALKYAWYTQLKKPRRGSRSLSRSLRRQVPRSTSEDFPVTLGDNAAWLAVERSVGPIHLAKLGLEYRDGAISFTPEMIVSVGDLKLLLEGISVSLPLSSSGKPAFQVNGFGLEYANDTLKVAGAFLRSPKQGYDEYAGMASLQLKLKGSGVGLAAIGAYADHPDTGTSLFLYASLNAPLGGPPFFFVTGLSGGFGYNRDLHVPPLERVKEFPLVSQALDGTGGWNSENASETVAGQLRKLSQYIPLQPDTGFLALGVKFTSFKMLDGFALLTVVLGKRFELGMLGLARLQVPFSGSKALAVVELALQARFSPSEGVAMVRGELTPSSYILNPSCRLTGGFAFATWFAGQHAGDFVLTMGGYHPRFKVPAHYPIVPRVGFEWRLGSTLSLRGESYFALCAHAVMAGGSLAAEFRSGSAWASFRMGADFLISWKPYAYDISLSLHFKFGLGCLKASLGADLRIWGPDFGGYAKLKVFLFSVKVKFGNQGSPAPKPIGWGDFQSSFLPASNEVCNIAVADGLTRQVQPTSGEALWIVNPKEFALTTDTLVPLSAAHHPESSTPVSGKALGVVPMGVKAGTLESTLRVTLTRDGGDVEKGKFKYTVIQRQMPAGMWGDPKVRGSGSDERLSFPGVNDTSFVSDALVGLRIEPGEPPKAGDTDDLPVAALRFDPKIYSNAYAFEPLSEFRAMPGDDGTLRAEIRKTIATHAARNTLLEALGFNPAEDVALSADVVETFVFAPQVKAA